MRNRKFLLILTKIVLGFFFASQVLAHEPIEGWDKAKFGMSPEDLRNAYAEEERLYLEEEYYKRKDYSKEHREPEEYLGREKDTELEEITMENPFWEKERENEFSYTPYILHTRELKVLGQRAEVWFYFVDNKLFGIRVEMTEFEDYPLSRTITRLSGKSLSKEEEEKEKIEIRRKKRKLMEKMREKYKTLMSFLNDKYGNPSIVDTDTDREDYRWLDTKSNTPILNCSLEVGEDRWNIEAKFNVIYASAKSEKVWLSKVNEWKKERKEIEERIREIKERIGIEAF